MKKVINTALKTVNYGYIKQQIDDAFIMIERYQGTPEAIRYARKLGGFASVLIKKTEMDCKNENECQRKR
jgi:hypothetical protein